MGAQLSDEYADGTYKFLLMNSDGSTTEQSWSRTNDSAYSNVSIFGNVSSKQGVTGITIRCTSADGETVQDYVFRFTTHAPYAVSFVQNGSVPPGTVTSDADYRQEDGCILKESIRTIALTEETESLTGTIEYDDYSILLDGKPVEESSIVFPIGEQDEEHEFTFYAEGAPGYARQSILCDLPMRRL